MKKIFAVLLALALSAAASPLSFARKIPTRRLTTLVSEYRAREGFEVVKVGSLMTSFLKGAIINGGVMGDDDASKALRAFKDIKKLMVVDYEEAPEGDRSSFSSRVGTLLEDCDVLMEVKEEVSSVRIYGHVDEAGGRVEDFVLFCPDDCALIYLTGSLSLDDLSGMMN